MHKTITIAIALGLLMLVPPANATLTYDCSEVPEGEICDAEDPSMDPSTCLVITCRVIVIVSIGDVGARDFNTGWGVPITAEAWASGKDTTASTGFANEVQIVTKMDWKFDFHDIYDSWDDRDEGFDQAEFWSDWDADGTPDKLPIKRTCGLCTGIYGKSTFGNGIFTHETDYLSTGFPAGTTYTTHVDATFLRWFDENQDDQYTFGVDRTYVNLIPGDYARITVGDFL